MLNFVKTGHNEIELTTELLANIIGSANVLKIIPAVKNNANSVHGFVPVGS